MRWPWVSRALYDLQSDRLADLRADYDRLWEAFSPSQEIETNAAHPVGTIPKPKASRIAQMIDGLAEGDASLRTQLASYASKLKSRGKSEGEILDALENDWVTTPVGDA